MARPNNPHKNDTSLECVNNHHLDSRPWNTALYIFGMMVISIYKNASSDPFYSVCTYFNTVFQIGSHRDPVTLR